MKKFGKWLKSIFFPPPERTLAMKLLPYGIIIIIVIGIGLFTTAAWEYTNTTVFCGTACHTMPPQYITHQNSDHARLTCEDCHLGRADLGELIIRKIQYSYQTGSAMLFNTYEYPIIAHNMRPARDVCETCHYPQVFSNDTLIDYNHFSQDENNTEYNTYLIMKTGGGSEREGQGYGIHWHIENPVLFYATDELMQDIPYIRVVHPDGTISEYVDTESDFDISQIDEKNLMNMDCMTCHNRTAHPIDSPDKAVDDLIARGKIDKDIPYIRNYAATALRGNFATYDEAKANINKLLSTYKTDFPVAYMKYHSALETAVSELWNYYQNNVFIDQKMKWDTHPDNSQHLNSPGCFRCHDGKHLTAENEAIRLECNLCHSIPVTSGPKDFVTNIEVSRGTEPSSHRNTNWISLHHQAVDNTCASCHTMGDPGGASNTSFCSNSGCHGQAWEFAGFDAPKLRQILNVMIETMPTPEPMDIPDFSGQPPTFEFVNQMFTSCRDCHGTGGLGGVNLSTYTSMMKGGDHGPIIVPGNADASLIVQIQRAEPPHFGQLTSQQVELLAAWINAGAKQ